MPPAVLVAPWGPTPDSNFKGVPILARSERDTAMALIDDLRATLQVCRDALPPDTHPIYVVRLQLIWTIVQWAAREHEAHWTNQLAAAERAVDAELAQRTRRTNGQRPR